jgi:hypothetical protein
MSASKALNDLAAAITSEAVAFQEYQRVKGYVDLHENAAFERLLLARSALKEARERVKREGETCAH